MKTQRPSDEWTARLEKRVAEIREKQSARKDFMTYQMHVKEWIREGRAEGIAIGERRGMAQGAHKKAVETVYTAIKMGMTTGDIVKLTGLSITEIEQLQDSTTQV